MLDSLRSTSYFVLMAEITNAFEQQIRALSPNGRRLALLRQKHDLEEEQAHLQKLLSKQEDLLKFRQAQLKVGMTSYSRNILISYYFHIFVCLFFFFWL